MMGYNEHQTIHRVVVKRISYIRLRSAIMTS
jgi:hypothetical protein